MATTLRTVINRVLTATGEKLIDVATTTLSSTYTLLILELINEIKEEIEDAHEWRVLRKVLTVSVTGGTNNASIANTNERTRVIRLPEPLAGAFVPLVFDVTNATAPTRLVEKPLAEILARFVMDGGLKQDSPQWFATDSNPDGTVYLYVYPTPQTTKSLQIHMTVPQATLTPSDLDTPILIPSSPLLKGSIWYAREEKGEEMGPSGLFTEERYRQSLDDAISKDAAQQGDPYQLVVS